MATNRRSEKAQHILLFGASGLSGLAFIQEHLAIPDNDSTKPYLTLYVRPSGRSKLTPILPNATSNDHPANKIRIISGDLHDAPAIRSALSQDVSFPKVATVISVLGAYVSLYHFLTRTKPTPIADALNSTIIPIMLELDIKRILVLSTPTAFQVPGESKAMSWGWYLHNIIPAAVVPQGNAEMAGIAYAVLDNTSGRTEAKHGLEATVFRVPFLTDSEGDMEVVAFEIGGEGSTENKSLSRRGLVKWLVGEIRERKWVGGAPMVCDRGGR